MTKFIAYVMLSLKIYQNVFVVNLFDASASDVGLGPS